VSGLDVRVIRPLDVVHLRGNRLFEGTGDGVAVMPPWPSLFAGALRTRMLADADALDRYATSGLDGEMAKALGRRYGERHQGEFRVAFACLAKEGEPLVPLPADVSVFDEHTTNGEAGGRRIVRLAPEPIPEGLCTSGPGLPCWPVLRERAKPERGPWYLRPAGVARWQRGETPDPTDLVHARELWKDDPRIGIARDRSTATVLEGMLYTSRAITLVPGVSFLVGVRGGHGCVPSSGLLRLGGDGRAATIAPFDAAIDDPPWERVPSRDRFTLWLVSPGAFEGGWRLPGCQNGRTWCVGTLKAEIVAASVARYEVVSGWDVARNRPKPATRVVPAGAVYWLERKEGDLGELRRVLEHGLGAVDRDREIEGFGAAWLGEW